MALQAFRRFDLRAALAASMGLFYASDTSASAKVIDLIDLNIIFFCDLAKGCSRESKRAEDRIDLMDV